MPYRELGPPAELSSLVECAWVASGPPAEVRVLPDGCMDLIRMDGRIVVAGPDTTASTSMRGTQRVVGLRFRPGVLPRLLGVPADRLRNERVPLADVRSIPGHSRTLIELASRLAAEEPRSDTAPWPMPMLHRVTGLLAAGVAVDRVAAQVGWSRRTLQRHCTCVYGYGPVTLRRILRFRDAQRLLRAGMPVAEAAARTGYADQPHLHREVRALAGVPVADLRQDASGANKSTQLPSGSATVA